MITTRCKSNNLLNYIRQKNIEHNVTFTFCNDRFSPNYLNWMGNFEFNGKTYNGMGRSKQKVVDSFMSTAEEDVFNFIKNRKDNN